MNGHHQGGANGVANSGNGSAPVMVEMGTGTSEDNMFAGAQKKNDLALSYSFWNVEDDENEGMLFYVCLLVEALPHMTLLTFDFCLR